jgi:hypothetical protein
MTPIQPRHRTALIGLLLTLPGVLMYTSLVLGLEPPLGPLAPVLATPATGPNVAGSLIVFIVIVAMPLAALIINCLALKPATGSTLKHYAANGIIVAIVLVLMMTVVGGVVADQYPCWAGVPNCD